MFTSTRFRFQTGARSGETVNVRNADGQVVLTYRGFASVVTIVAALVASIVLVVGAAGVAFLIHERRGPAAAAAAILSLAFFAIIAALVPRTRVTLYDGSKPALMIEQQSRVAFPRTTYAVKTPDGATIALLGRSMMSRLGRNSWTIDSPADQRGSAFAVEESLWRAIVRKVVGKFNAAHEANIRIYYHGVASGVIVRRPDPTGDSEYLDLADGGSLDRRVAVALATLVFGAEP